MARRGKIARLPERLRNEVCQRLLANEPASKLLPWLNAQAEVKKVLASYFGGEPVTEPNLTAWRQGGFQEWLDRREQVDSIKDLSAFCGSMYKAGANLSDGAAAVLTGKLISAIEGAEAADLVKLSAAVAAMRGGDIDRAKLKLLRERVDQQADRLTFDQKRWRMRTTELVLKHLQDKEAMRIANAPNMPDDVKTEALGKRLFGEDW